MKLSQIRIQIFLYSNSKDIVFSDINDFKKELSRPTTKINFNAPFSKIVDQY